MDQDVPRTIEDYKHGALRSTGTLAIILALLGAALYGLGATALAPLLLGLSVLVLWPALLFTFALLRAYDRANPLPSPKVLLRSTPGLAREEWAALRDGLAEIFLPALGIAAIVSVPLIFTLWMESRSEATIGQNAIYSALIFGALFTLITSINVAMRLAEHGPRLRRAFEVDRAIVRERRAHVEDSELEGALHVADLSSAGDLSLTADHGAMSVQEEVALDLDEQPAEVAQSHRP